MVTLGGDPGPIYEDPDAHRRFNRFAAVLLTALAVVILAGLVGVGAMIVAERRNSQETLRAAEADDALTVTALAGLSSNDALGAVLGAARLDGLVVGESGTAVVAAYPALPLEARTDMWRESVAARAAASSARSFATEGPDGRQWLHSVVRLSDGRLLVTGRPAPSAGSLGELIAVGLLVAAAVSVAAVYGVWLILRRRVVVPVQMLVDAGEDLRVRGEIRGEVRRALDRIAERPLELKRLGVTLRQIEADSHRGAEQAEALLGAAGSLAATLDPAAVLEASLGYLQRLLGVDGSAILQLDERRKMFRVAAMRGPTAEWRQDVSSVEAQEWLPSIRAIREGLPVQISDTETSAVGESLRRRAARHGYKSVLAVPLSRLLEAPTVMILQCRRARSYSFDEIELCKSFASIASAALQNAELFARTDERLRQTTSRLEAIVESVDQGLVVTGSDGRVVYVNAMMRELVGPGVAVEKLTSDAFVELILAGQENAAALQHQLATLETDSDDWIDVTVSRAHDGAQHRRSFRVRLFVVRDATGNEMGRGQIWTDIRRERELELMKSGLLAAVSHEFRAPLALIKGYATTLLADDVNWDAADQRQFLGLVSREADRLTELVQRVLDMSRIDAGMVDLQRTPVEIESVIRNAIESAPQWGERVAVGELPMATVEVDSTRIVTAIRNLVDNACKYSAATEQVQVSAWMDDGEVCVSVRDNGPGIEPGMRERIFDTFVRGNEGLDGQSGIGLGLAISRGFVDAHGGRLGVAETNDDSGTEFRLWLPVAQAVSVHLGGSGLVSE